MNTTHLDGPPRTVDGWELLQHDRRDSPMIVCIGGPFAGKTVRLGPRELFAHRKVAVPNEPIDWAHIQEIGNIVFTVNEQRCCYRLMCLDGETRLYVYAFQGLLLPSPGGVLRILVEAYRVALNQNDP